MSIELRFNAKQAQDAGKSGKNAGFIRFFQPFVVNVTLRFPLPEPQCPAADNMARQLSLTSKCSVLKMKACQAHYLNLTSLGVQFNLCAEIYSIKKTVELKISSFLIFFTQILLFSTYLLQLKNCAFGALTSMQYSSKLLLFSTFGDICGQNGRR